LNYRPQEDAGRHLARIAKQIRPYRQIRKTGRHPQ
jgi:hypothetical protein